MPVPLRTLSRVVAGGAVPCLLTALLAGCDQSPSGPKSRVPAPFFQTVSLPDFQNNLITGPVRVAISIIPGTLTARRVAIEEPEALSHPEEIRSHVTAVSAATAQGTLTLELGGLQIAFNSATRFRPDDGDGNQGDMALADFVARVKQELAAGRHPTVKARRNPPAQPQAPGDASFLASELKLDEGNNHPLIKLNVTGVNLVTNPTPPPDAWLKVLGLSVAVEVSDGTTKLEVENPELAGVREFAGIVQSVDATAQTVTLKDGTVIRIVAGSAIEPKEGADDNDLTSLAAVQAALTAGQTVKTEGDGLVDHTNPLTLDAITIEFEVEVPEPAPAG